MTASLRAILDRQLTEDQMRTTLVQAAHIGGWLHMHIRDSRRQDATGFPDDCFLKDGRLFLWELKRVNGRLSPEQTIWLEALQRFIKAHNLGGFMEARVIRPADMPVALALLSGGEVL